MEEEVEGSGNEITEEGREKVEIVEVEKDEVQGRNWGLREWMRRRWMGRGRISQAGGGRGCGAGGRG